MRLRGAKGKVDTRKSSSGQQNVPWKVGGSSSERLRGRIIICGDERIRRYEERQVRKGGALAAETCEGKRTRQHSGVKEMPSLRYVTNNENRTAAMFRAELALRLMAAACHFWKVRRLPN